MTHLVTSDEEVKREILFLRFSSSIPRTDTDVLPSLVDTDTAIS